MDKPGLGQIALVNALLFVLTLTIYRFWAKTNVRRHIWSCVHINGEPLEYTGRGTELFLGALIVFGLFILPIFAVVLTMQLWLGPEHPALILVNLVILLFVVVFWGMALYRARRYQLSRTLWRGIRGALVGSSWTYSLLYFGAMLLRSMTLGWSTPAMNLNLQERMTGDMRFGSMPFRFRGRAGPLYGSYAVCWVTTLFVFLLIAALFGFAFYSAFGDTLGEIFAPDGPGPRTDLDLIALILLIGGYRRLSVVQRGLFADLGLLRRPRNVDLRVLHDARPGPISAQRDRRQPHSAHPGQSPPGDFHTRYRDTVRPAAAGTLFMRPAQTCMAR